MGFLDYDVKIRRIISSMETCAQASSTATRAALKQLETISVSDLLLYGGPAPLTKISGEGL